MSNRLSNSVVAPTWRKVIATAVFTLATFATGVTCYLSWHALSATSVGGCSASAVFGCDEVLSTKWSKLAGVPVALFATLNYTAIAVAALLLLVGDLRLNRAGVTLLIPTALLATAAAFWFTGLQLFAVAKLCKWCLITHTCGVVIGVLTAFLLVLSLRRMLVQPSDQDVVLPAGKHVLATVGLAVLAFSILIAGQFVSDDPIEVVDLAKMATLSEGSAEHAESTEALRPTAPVQLEAPPTPDASGTIAPAPDAPVPSAPRRIESPAGQATQAAFLSESRGEDAPADGEPALGPPVVIFPDRPAIPRQQLILLGDATAPHVMIECASYTCPSCRIAHPKIKSIQRRYGDSLAVAVMPIPLEMSCNPVIKRDHAQNRDSCRLTRLALAVWELNPAKFPELHDWLMSSPTARPYEEAWQRACLLAAEDELREMIDSERVKNRITQHNEYLRRFDTIPAIIIGSKMIKGRAVYESEHLENFVDSQLGGSANL